MFRALGRRAAFACISFSRRRWAAGAPLGWGENGLVFSTFLPFQRWGAEHRNNGVIKSPWPEERPESSTHIV